MKYGEPPTRGDYGHRFEATGPDQSIVVPQAYPGVWYGLVYGQTIATPSTYNLLASSSPMFVTGVAPPRHGNTRDAVLTVGGAGFNPACVVSLVAGDGTAYLARTSSVDAYTRITATFAANTIPAGAYSVRVSQPDGVTSELPNGFIMAPGEEPSFEVRLVTPSQVDWTGIQSSLRPAWLEPEAWDALYPHLTAQVGPTWGDYVRMLNANVTTLGQLGQTVNEIPALWNFEIRKLAGFDPIRSLASRFDLVVPASGLVLGINRTYGQNLERRFRTGPFGRGWSTLWSVSLVVQPDGAVEITRHNGAIRRFEPDSRTGGYFAPLGDPSVLTWHSGGAFVLAEPEGSLLRFDPQGQLESMTDSSGNRIDAVHTDGLLSRLTHSSGASISLSYNAGGRRTRMTDHLGFALNYHYDPAGRLIAISDDEGTTLVEYAYDASSRVVREDRANGTSTTSVYDCAGQLTELAHHTAGVVTSTFAYTYDRQGQVTTLATLEGEWDYAYDPQGQLVSAGFRSANGTIPDQSLSYAYDATGNRLQTIENGVTTDYAVNALNQYTAIGGSDLAYDADGHLTARTGNLQNALAEYNCHNRLTRLATPEGTWAYEYDPFGHCTAVVHNGQRTEYLVDPVGLGTITAEFDSRGQLVARYLHGQGLTGRIEPTGETRFFEYDGLGSVCGLTGAAGEHLNRYAYDPYGQKLLSVETVPNTFQFVGRFGVLTADHGWSLMHARFYDPAAGRFVSADPIGFAGNDPNLYRYAGNAPTYRSDPRGYDRTALGRTVCVDNPWGRGGIAASFNYTPDDHPFHECIDMHEFVHAEQCRERGPHRTPQECNRREAEALVAELECINGFGLREVSPEYVEETEDLLRRARRNQHPDCPPDDPPPPPPPDPPPGPGDSGATSPAGSSDPNAKIGPGGYGDAQFVPAATLLSYAVHFENLTNATAPAQQVWITDPLADTLDWTSFELTEIAFGDRFLAVPPHRQHFQTTEPMRFNGVDFEVEIEAGIRLAAGEVYAVFRSIVPATSLPPSVDVGFLPPEDGTGRGQGHIAYTLRPKSDLTSGTELRNVAFIVFDQNPSIATNQRDPLDPSKGTDPNLEALVTIDGGPPNSRVLPLPQATVGPAFTVEWVGQDDPGGAGIAAYAIYVSENAGPWELWQEHPSANSAVFNGQIGHTYAFFSVARDHLGHQESPPLEADTLTTLVLSAVPELQIQVVGGTAIVSWPTAAEGFMLESTESLSDPGSWEPDASVPSLTGDLYLLVVEPGAQLRFYRLARPGP